MDICGPLPISNENKYILVTVDAFSKWVIATPTIDQTARTITEAFIEQVLTKHGAPHLVVTDNGKQFLSTIFKELAEIFGFEHHTSAPYHQEANGQVERQNRTIAAMLRTSVALGGEDWTELLQMAIFAHNTSIQASTKQSPFYVLHGREPRLPSDVALKIPPKGIYNEISTFVQDLATNIQNAWRIVKENMTQAQEQYTHYADQDRKAMSKEWKIGQLVLHTVNAQKAGHRHKFGPKWKGPYRIVHIERPNVMLKELAQTARPFRTHMNMIKQFHEPYVLPLRSMNEGTELSSREDEKEAEPDADQ